MMKARIYIDFTDEQAEELKELSDMVTASCDTDAPGMIFGQAVVLEHGGIQAVFIYADYETSLKLQVAIGTPIGTQF
jgi:hypothetical protein